jgi:hypothetical protein
MPKRKLRKPGNQPIYDAEKYLPLLKSMFAKGESLTAYLVEADICEATFYEWTNKYPDFDEAYAKANATAQKYWENVGVNGMEKPNFNWNVYNSIMTNRFGVTSQRKLRVRGIAAAASHTGRFDVVMNEVDKGSLTAHEIKQISDSLVCGVKIAEVTSMADDIKGLQQKLNDNNSRVGSTDNDEDNI